MNTIVSCENLAQRRSALEAIGWIFEESQHDFIVSCIAGRRHEDWSQEAPTRVVTGKYTRDVFDAGALSSRDYVLANVINDVEAWEQDHQ